MSIELLEDTFRTWILAGVTPEIILLALHNVCVHGDILSDIGNQVSDKQLGKLYDGFDKSLAAFRKMAR